MRQNKSRENQTWYEIKARYEFLWILILLLWCGYLSSPNLILYFLGLIFFGVNSVNTSLYNLSLQKIKEISEMDEESVSHEILKIQKANEILLRFQQNIESPSALRNQEELLKLQKNIEVSLNQSRSILATKIKKRQDREQWEKSEQLKLGYRSGSPPTKNNGNFSCPKNYPIRATRKHKLYYLQNERAGMDIHWCFPTAEAAERDGFSRPKYKQPERQHKRKRKSQ